MRKTLNDQDASKRLSETMEVIGKNFDREKMKIGAKVNPLFRLPDDYDPELGLDNKGMSDLLVAWLKIQGVSLVFDDTVVRQHLDQGLSRLEKLIPPK